MFQFKFLGFNIKKNIIHTPDMELEFTLIVSIYARKCNISPAQTYSLSRIEVLANTFKENIDFARNRTENCARMNSLIFLGVLA